MAKDEIPPTKLDYEIAAARLQQKHRDATWGGPDTFFVQIFVPNDPRPAPGSKVTWAAANLIKEILPDYKGGHVNVEGCAGFTFNGSELVKFRQELKKKYSATEPKGIENLESPSVLAEGKKTTPDKPEMSAVESLPGKKTGGGMLNKLKKAGNTKINLGPADLAGILTGSIALSGIMTAADAKVMEAGAQGQLDEVKIIEKAAKTDNAPKTEAALQQERIAATSKIIEAQSAEKWGLGVGLGSGAIAAAAARSALKKKKPGEVTDESTDKDKGRS